MLHLFSAGKDYKIALVPYNAKAQDLLKPMPIEIPEVVLQIVISNKKLEFKGNARIENFKEAKQHTIVEIESTKKDKFLLVFDVQSTVYFGASIGNARVFGDYEFGLEY